jgi:voltage-gated potassium channel
VYLHALYWCVATLTTVGYGDITPVTNAEIFYAMLVMVLGVAMYGYLIGHIANILANINPARARYQESMQKLTAFMSYRGIPDRLRRRIRDYHTYIWGQRLGYDESTILDGLPPSLLTEVSLFLKRDIIHKVPFFKEANDDLIREIALEMRPLVFMPGDIVFREGDQGKGMYFISRGRLEVLSGDGKQVLAVLSDGDIFGETALLRGQPRNASVRAVGYCDLYTLDKHSFDRILTDYPEFAAHLEAMTRVREGRGP